jgi:hypothetical protein
MVEMRPVSDGAGVEDGGDVAEVAVSATGDATFCGDAGSDGLLEVCGKSGSTGGTGRSSIGETELRIGGSRGD